MIRNNAVGNEQSLLAEGQSLGDLLMSYQRNAQKLFAAAQKMPSETSADHDVLEIRLIADQADIIDKACNNPITHKFEAKLVLDIWYQSVIQETCEADISAGDQLVLALYKSRYFAD